MSFGVDWTCDCGWGNLDVRKHCRFCGKRNPTNPLAVAAVSEPDRDVRELVKLAIDKLRVGMDAGPDGQNIVLTPAEATIAYRLIIERSAPVADAALSVVEMKAQGDRCSCGGADDYCPCQNVPDRETRRIRALALPTNEGRS